VSSAAKSSAYAVLDTSFHQGAFRVLAELGVRFVSLFDDTPEAALIDIAPLLVSLSDSQANGRARVLALGRTAPCLTALGSPLALPELAQKLGRLHQTNLEDGGELVLRWYDTRVQPVWLASLEFQQQRAVFSGIDCWYGCDRFGQWLRHVAPPHAADSAPADMPLKLSIPQFAALLESAQVDVVLNHLDRVITDEVRATDKRTLFMFVEQHLRAAIGAGYEGLDDQTQYLLPLLYTSGKAADTAEFQRAIAPQSSVQQPLAERMLSMSDATWQVASPLWVTAPKPEREPPSPRPEFPNEIRSLL
jgi:hypothetical protein